MGYSYSLSQKRPLSWIATKYREFLHKRLVLIVLAQVSWIFLHAQTNWAILGFWANERVLGKDLQFVAVSVVCDRNQSFFSSFVAKQCENYYGITLIRFLRIVGFDLDNFKFFYLVMTCTTILITSLIFYRYTSELSSFKKISWFFIVFGPFYLLLIHRGNIDQVIFDCLVISFYLHSKNKTKLLLYALVFCALIKFYTFPLLLIYAYYYAKRSVFTWVLTIAVTVEIAREVQQIDFLPIRNISSSFGLSIFMDYYFMLDQISSALKIVFVLIIIAATWKVISFTLKENAWSFKNAPSHSMGEFFILQHLVCYVAFLNYDWRLIFVIFSFFISSHKITDSKRSTIYFALALVVSWSSSGFNQIALFGDVLLYLLFVFLSVKFCASLFGYASGLYREKKRI